MQVDIIVLPTAGGVSGYGGCDGIAFAPNTGKLCEWMRIACVWAGGFEQCVRPRFTVLHGI